MKKKENLVPTWWEGGREGGEGVGTSGREEGGREGGKEGFLGREGGREGGIFWEFYGQSFIQKILRELKENPHGQPL